MYNWHKSKTKLVTCVEHEEFARRLTQLRMQKGVSAREMSLAMGQNKNYINMIESGSYFPSMQGFFYICEYLEITPAQFFDMESPAPAKLNELLSYVQAFSETDLEILLTVAKGLHK